MHNDPFPTSLITSTGQDICKFKRLRLQRQRYICHVAFLVECKHRKLIPKFIHVKCSIPSTHRVRRTLRRLHRIMLRTCIQDARGKLAFLESQLYSLHLSLSLSLPVCEWNHLDTTSATYTSTQADQHFAIHRKKISNLSVNSHAPAAFPNLTQQQSALLNNPKVVNMSTINITHSEQKILELGLNFSRSSPRVNLLDITSHIERSFKFSRISPAQKDVFRKTISDVLISNSKTHPNNTSNLHPSEVSALKSLQANPELVVTSADKGGTTVILSLTQYHEGMLHTLQNGSYSKLAHNPISGIITKLKTVVKGSNYLDDSRKKALIPSNSSPGRIYILPKIHKPVLTFRPIVSCINTPTYQLSKFLSKNLSYLTDNNQHILKNSSAFVKALHTQLATNVLLVSFDIVSLFTSVPIAGALVALKNRLIVLSTPPDDIDSIMKLVEICVRSTVFSYNHVLYSQHSGLPMGGCLSPLLCDLYLLELETRIFSISPFPLIFWRRYVDDIFNLWSGEICDIPIFLEFINDLDPHIQFTYQLECNNQLPFLDVHVTRFDDHFETTVYRKPFSVQTPPHVRSGHIFSQKVSSFYFFARRALDFCSTPALLQSEINFLKCVAIDRGYSTTLIDQAIRKCNTQNKTFNTTLTSDSNPSLPYLTLPFSGKTSARIATIFRGHFRVSFIPLNKFSSVLHCPKDTTPDDQKWGIYFIPCQCPVGYIGQTRRSISIRVKEHMSCVKKGETSRSNIAAHAWSHQHNFKFNEARVIKTTKFPIDLNFLESFHILKFASHLINDSHIPPISNIWRDVISLANIRPLPLSDNDTS